MVYTLIMNYIIRYIKDGETIAVDDTFFEHPTEDYLREQCLALGADFADICRAED